MIGLPNSFFSLKIIILINLFPYPFTKALLFHAQMYSPVVAFLYRFSRLLWFIMLTFKPECKIIDFFKGITTRATSVVEGRKEGIIGRSITAQVGRGRCDQRSGLRIAIFSRCLRSLPFQLWVVAPSLFIDEWKEPPGWPTELQEYIAYNLYSGLFRCLGHPWPYHILPKVLGPIPLSPNIVTRP